MNYKKDTTIYNENGSAVVEIDNPGIEIYEADDGSSVVEVKHDNDTLYLSLNQISLLFDRDKSVISRHLANIFREEELRRDLVVAFFATTAKDDKTYKVEHFNLDVIISVGYRVNSKQGTRFRKWATSVLQSYAVTGCAINFYNLTKKKSQDIEQTLNLLSKTLVNQFLVNDLGASIIRIVQNYSKTWHTLLEYDENRIESEAGDYSRDLVEISYE